MLLHFIEIQTLCSFCSKLCVVMLFWVLESRSGFLLGFCSINGSRKNSNDILFHFFFCWRSHKKGSFPIGIGIKGRSIFSGIFFSFHSLDLQHVNQWIEQVKQEQILSSDSFFCKLGLMLLLPFLSFLPSSASAFWCQYWAKQSIKDILLSKQKHHTCRRPLRLLKRNRNWQMWLYLFIFTPKMWSKFQKMARWRIFDLDFPKLWNKAQIISEC